jgi:RNA polymerase sigma factor (sigma-70 family)
VQEALWIAVQRIGTLRVASTFTVWLFQVVKHECYRLLRRFRREEPIEQLALQRLSHLAADQAILAQDIARAIALLPPAYRQVLVMRDVQGMTAPEVAATLGITVEAVKSRLHRARAILRAALYNCRAYT